MSGGQKQAVRRPSQRARLAVRRAPALQAKAEARKAQARAPIPRQLRRASWRAVLLSELIALLFIVILAHGQFEIAWVMLSSRPAQATVMAVSCSRGKYTIGDATVTFRDANGVAHTVAHSNDTNDCFGQYHAGETVPIRYSTALPNALLTQAELDDLPSATVFYALIDLFCLALPILMLRYPDVVAALVRRLPGRKLAQRTRYGQDISE